MPWTPTEDGPLVNELDEVAVVDANGRIISTARDSVQEGDRLATPADLQAKRDQLEFGDTGSQIAAGAEGLAQGASVGLYGYGASIVAPEYAEELRKRESANPVTSAAANVVGAVAPALLSGGSSAGATALRYTPAALEASLGAKLATHLGAKAASWTSSKLVQAGVRAGVSGLEGAADNAMRRVLDDASADIPITAERMSASLVDGFVMGAGMDLGLQGLGAAFRGAKGGLGKLGGAAEDLPAATQADEVAGAVASPARPRADVDFELDAAQKKLAEADSIGDSQAADTHQEIVDRLSAERDAAVLAENGVATDLDLQARLDLGDASKTEEVRGIWGKIKQHVAAAKDAKMLDGKFDDLADDLTGSMTRRLNELRRKKAGLDQYIDHQNKPKAARAAFERGGTVWTEAHASKLLDDSAENIRVIDRVIDEYSSGGNEAARSKLPSLRQAKAQIEGLVQYVTGVRGQGPIGPNSRILRGDPEDVVQIFLAKNNLKKALGRAAKGKGQAASPNEALLRRFYGRERGDLQDKSLFGEGLAEFQTVTNAAETAAIPAEGVFRARFGLADSLKGERVGDGGWDILDEVGAPQMKGLIRAAGDADAYQAEEAFVKGLVRHLDLIEAKAKYYPMPDDVRAEIPGMRAVADVLIEDLRMAKVVRSQAKAAKKLVDRGDSVGDVIGLLDKVGGLGLVGKITGVLGSAVRAKRAVTPRPKSAALAEGAATLEERVARTVDSVTRLDKGRPIKQAAIMSANTVARHVRTAQALQDPASPESKAFDASITEVSLDDAGLAAALSTQVRATAAFLAGKVPRVTDANDPLGLESAPVDAVTQSAVGRYVRAAQDPAAAFERIGSGRGSAEDREVVQTLFPRLYEDFAGRIVEGLLRRAVRPSLAQQYAIGAAIGRPVGRSSQPDYMMAVASAMALVPEAPPPPARTQKLDVDDHYASRTDEIMSDSD